MESKCAQYYPNQDTNQNKKCKKWSDEMLPPPTWSPTFEFEGLAQGMDTTMTDTMKIENRVREHYLFIHIDLSSSDSFPGLSPGEGLGGLQPPQFLTDQLTLSQPGGAHYPQPVLQSPPDFQTLRRACFHNDFYTIMCKLSGM